MIKIDLHSQTPIYAQIKTGLKGLVRRGLLLSGDAAPSIRTLAAQLKLNPNTVARAYRELSVEGFFESKRGEENIISSRAGALRPTSGWSKARHFRPFRPIRFKFLFPLFSYI